MSDDKSFDQISLDDLVSLIAQLERHYNATIVCDDAIFREVIQKVSGYLNEISNPSAYKVSGTMSFWIRKLKPFYFNLQEKSKNPTNFLNETIAVLHGYNYLRAYKAKEGGTYPNLSSKFLTDLTVQLRYSAFSPSSIAMLFWALCHER